MSHPPMSPSHLTHNTAGLEVNKLWSLLVLETLLSKKKYCKSKTVVLIFFPYTDGHI